MLTVLKKSGAKSTAGDVAKKGSKGRLELFAARDEDGNYAVRFTDYGNYGKSRWEADFGSLDDGELGELIASLVALRNGDIDTTHVPFDQVVASQAVVDEEEPVEAEALPVEPQEVTQEVQATA